MIRWGGTWESFDARIGNSSTSHAWAAHPIYHLVGTLGGVMQQDLAWRRIAFAPVLGMPETDRAAVAVPTPHGIIRASWRRMKKGADVSLALPKGVAADVILPGMKPVAATGRSRWRVS
jgi:hypothetical protein